MDYSPSPCFYCHLEHPKMEAAGIFYCPNPLCRGPGAAWFRRTLDSYTENEDGSHCVCEKELKKKGNLYKKEHPDTIPCHLKPDTTLVQ